MAAREDTADFRSDTVTRPGPAMRQAMAVAEVGDDVLGEDPTVTQLEREAAAWLGMPAAVFVPSGTMANQIAVHVHCRPGDELICEERSHVYFYEGGSVARLSGTQVRLFPSEDGFPQPQTLTPLVRAADAHYPRSRLLVLENTHNMAGGRVMQRPRLAAVVAEAHRLGLLVHVDGARLANAAAATGLPAAELIDGVDSVSLCFSKGLGAPVGSVVAGSEAFVRQARLARKAFGGGMRQAGILAAAARMALAEGPAKLARDHARAQLVAGALQAAPALRVDPADVHSNILMLDLCRGSVEDLQQHLAGRGILVGVVGPSRLRFVFHQDLTDEHVERCIEAVLDWAAAILEENNR